MLGPTRQPGVGVNTLLLLLSVTYLVHARVVLCLHHALSMHQWGRVKLKISAWSATSLEPNLCPPKTD